MRKRDELTNAKSCMFRAKEDEMTFVLLGRDIAAPLAPRGRDRVGEKRDPLEQLLAVRTQFGGKKAYQPGDQESTTVAALIDPIVAEYRALADQQREHEERVEGLVGALQNIVLMKTNPEKFPNSQQSLSTNMMQHAIIALADSAHVLAGVVERAKAEGLLRGIELAGARCSCYEGYSYATRCNRCVRLEAEREAAKLRAEAGKAETRRRPGGGDLGR